MFFTAITISVMIAIILFISLMNLRNIKNNSLKETAINLSIIYVIPVVILPIAILTIFEPSKIFTEILQRVQRTILPYLITSAILLGVVWKIKIKKRNILQIITFLLETAIPGIIRYLTL